MEAVVINGKLDIERVEAPLPHPGPGQVRIRVDYVGICGSDLHYYFEGANGAFVVEEPLVPGHELSGRVDLDPRGSLVPGTPVTVHPAHFGTPVRGIEQEPHLWPGGSYLGSAATRPHSQGAMAEYLLVDAASIRELPETLPVRRAVLAEPLAVGLHAIHRAEGVEGKRVLVSGAGPIGLLAVAAARALGAASITVSDVLVEPLERARALGADELVRVGEDSLPEEGFDVVLECSGAAAAISASFVAARRRGVVVQVGMVPAEARPLALAPLISKELSLRGTFRFNDEIDEAVRLLDADPSIEAVITHVLGVDEVAAAFEIAKDSTASGKVVVRLSPDGDARS